MSRVHQASAHTYPSVLAILQGNFCSQRHASIAAKNAALKEGKEAATAESEAEDASEPWRGDGAEGDGAEGDGAEGDGAEAIERWQRLI